MTQVPYTSQRTRRQTKTATQLTQEARQRD